MSRYDEDIYENPFFQTLISKHSTLYEEAAHQRWMIVIPRIGSAGRLSFNKGDFETHILHPAKEDSGAWTDGVRERSGVESLTTVNKKEVTVSGDEISTGSGFRELRVVKILFEETFFNSDDKSFKVLCIDQPLEGAVVDNIALPTLENLTDCVQFLWSDSGNKRALKAVDEIVEMASHSFRFFQGQSMRQTMDAVTAVYTRAMQTVLKDSNLRKPSLQNKAFMSNIKLSVETYVMASLHGKIFNGVCSLVASDDASINKATRNLLDLQLRDLGVRAEVFQNVSGAREMIAQLNKFKTPLEKLCCLKRTVLVISSCQQEMVTADDLLPTLVFLVVKSEIPNWLGNLVYMHNFSLAGSLSEEFRYILSSFEAAVQHVKDGHLTDFRSSVRQRILHSPSKPLSSVPWQSLDNPDGVGGFSAVDRLFDVVARNAVVNVAALLTVSVTESHDNVVAQLCHPLCSCDKCEKLMASNRNDVNSVTVYSRDDRGFTALHVAAQEGHIEVMSLLIERKSQVNAADFHGSTPLHIASQRGNQTAVILLIDNSANVNVVDNDGNSPLHLCCVNGHEECAKVFFFQRKQAVDVNLPNEHGDTALHNAAKWGYEEIVRLLLGNGASPHALNRKKETPLQCAHNAKVMRLLQQAAVQDEEYVHVTPGVDIPRVTSHGVTPLNRKKIQTERRLMKLNLSPGTEKTLHPGEFSPHDLEVQRLIQACNDGDIQMVRFKLGLAEDKDEDEGSPGVLQLCHPLCQCTACSKIREQVSQRVILSVDESDWERRTALHVASLRGHRSIVQLLLRRGASVNIKNKLKQTPLHLACQYNHQDIAMLLIEYGARVNCKDERGNTPLHFCCSNGHDASAAILLFHDAYVNIVNNRGETPLHNASRWGHPTLVSALLHHGALPNTKNSAQLTPCQLTQNDEVIHLLDQAQRGEMQVGIYARGGKRIFGNDDYHGAHRLREDSKTSLSRSLPGLAGGNPIANASNTAAVKGHPVSDGPSSLDRRPRGFTVSGDFNASAQYGQHNIMRETPESNLERTL